MPTFKAEIYSPRWGHNDTYSFIFDKETLTVSFAPRVATCTWHENQDPTWAGEPLDDMLNNDSIYPPAVFTSLIEHLWKSWRNGDIREEEVNTELQLIVTWLNEMTAKKPRSDFWRKYF